MKLVVIALLLCPSLALASDKYENTTTNAAVCPIEIYTSGPSTHDLNDPDAFDVRLKNTSGKEIIGVKLSLEMLDAVGDLELYPEPLTAAGKVKVGKSTTSTWRLSPGSGKNLYVGYRLTIVKLAYSDDTTWVDDGTRKCHYYEDSRSR